MGLNLDLFESKVDRSGEDHLWTGAIDQSGTGQFKVDGRVRSPATIAWELAHGDAPEGYRVQACADERLCIRPEHLRLRKYGTKKSTIAKRANRGSGSMREVAPGKWKLTVDAGRDNNQRRRRITRTVRGTKRDAARALAVLGAEVQSGERVPAQHGSAVTVGELMDWYVKFARDVRGLERTTVFGYQEVFDVWLRPRIGHVLAERLTPARSTKRSDECGPRASPTAE